MRLTNDCYLISLRTSRVEYYFRDGPGWVKQSTTGRRFKATAEQVLNHLLPALAGVNPKVGVDPLSWTGQRNAIVAQDFTSSIRFEACH